MTYQEVLQYLYAQLPMFHRVGPAAYKPGLDNTIALMDMLGNPQHALICVHVAGTNGKGSVSHMIASVLQEAGYRTGLYTSPHLVDFRERIRINGACIAEDDVVRFVENFRHAWEKIQPSFFELTMAMAFWYFKNEKTEINVIETGLGGRLDSTNIITPLVSVITNVGMDHMNLLGNTLEKIATEKAGIIKPGIPVVLGPMRPQAVAVMHEQAEECGAQVFAAEMQTDVPHSDLAGSYQEENKRTAYTALQVLAANGWKISATHIAGGFASVRRNTGLMGRWQVLGASPLVVADVAHNEDGISAVVRQLNETSFRALHIVLGMVADKDIRLVLRLLPHDATYYFCKANLPRGLDAQLLANEAAQFGLSGNVYASVADAFAKAVGAAAQEDLVLVTGSIFTVAEVL
ncbi:MAG: bifunctional folylpolyglutamate synthase/dihydrofolate synthase [Flavobacteriales bacterium]|nr:bifunctional folylpolyglutamate synthase/dihydrofolate synthase [Flavobacteriales bacterium]